jgi:cellulose synthase/poly-beta-1,6-N-acetylglucosamine synthase-like glycosyltransferase
MKFLVGASLALLAGTFFIQAYWVWRFAALRNQVAGETREDGFGNWPSVAVILCLRGADPSLEACLNGLFHQDYPDYSVRVVVDHLADPSWEVLPTTGLPVEWVEVLPSPLATCSLKNSSLLYALEGLPDSTEIIVLIDADVVPGPTWLRSMIAPFSDQKVGASTGIRWYDCPAKAGIGTVVRALWGAAAAGQIYAFQIPWGGSLAFRRSLLMRHS